MSGALSRISIEIAARDLVRHVAQIRQRGWCDGTSGNFSVVLDHDPIRVLITPSGADKGTLDESDLLVVGEDARPVDGWSGVPSAETLLHTTLAARVAPGAILHTHSVWNTLLGEAFASRGGLAISGYEMQKGIAGVRSHDEELFVPVVENTQDMTELAARLELLLQRHPGLHGFLIAGHGMYTWGRDLEQAHRHVEIFEFLFQLVGRRTSLAPFPC